MFFITNYKFTAFLYVPYTWTQLLMSEFSHKARELCLESQRAALKLNASGFFIRPLRRTPLLGPWPPGPGERGP